MNWVHTLTIVVHVLLAASIIGLVLLQRGRGAEAGAGFGAGASGTVFGARGSASFLSRMTATMAALFFVSSLALAYLGGERKAPVSILDSAPVSAPAATTEAPVPAATDENATSEPAPAPAEAASSPPAEPSEAATDATTQQDSEPAN